MYFDYKLTWENWRGEQLDLTDESSGIYLDYVEGIHPVKAEHSTASSPYQDGAKLTNARIGVRNIGIYLELGSNVEANKMRLYKMFRKKKEGTLRYKSAERDVYIKGYVEDITPNQYSNPVSVQIVLLCLDPYWLDAQAIVGAIAQNQGALRFKLAITKARPFGIYETNTTQAIYNSGDVELGMRIRIFARGDVELPMIYNSVTNEYFKLELEMLAGDEVIIVTESGKHSVTLNRAGQAFNIFSLMSRGSTWLQLDDGKNIFGIDAENGANMLSFTIQAVARYEGV